jgi:uncharacterized protein YecE (DUF72 family)
LPGASIVLLRVGCAQWTHRAWGQPPGRELAHYATGLTAVEGNTIFYAVPTAETLARWHEQMPPGFHVCPKLPRSITHDRRLRRTDAELHEFLERFEPLLATDNLGPVSIQLPASFGPNELTDLEAFLQALPTDWPWALEVRHPHLVDGGSHQRRLDALLHRLGIDRVTLDSRALFSVPPRTEAEREAHGRKPRLPVRPIATAWRPIVRFIGTTEPADNDEFLRPWVDRVAQWLDEGRSPYVFCHTPDNAEAPALARAFHAAVADVASGVAALPEPPGSETQLTMW